MRKIACFLMASFCIPGFLSGVSLETSLSTLGPIFTNKPIVLANTIHAHRSIKETFDKYTQLCEKISAAPISEAKKNALLQSLATNMGLKVIAQTKKFFDVLQEFSSWLKPVVEAGLSENGIDVEGSMLNQFLTEGAAPVEARAQTREGLCDVCDEISVLVVYLQGKFPDQFVVGEEYLEETLKQDEEDAVAEEAEESAAEEEANE